MTVTNIFRPNSLDALVDVVNADTSTPGNAFLAYTAETVFDAVLDVTAATGTTPTLDVVIETSSDLGVTWTALDTFTQATGVSTQTRRITAAHGDQVRARWVLGGPNPVFSFNIKTYKVAATLMNGVAVAASASGTAAIGYTAQAIFVAELDVTAATGTTPTLNVIVEHSSDSGATWATLATFAQKTAAGIEVIRISAAHGDQIRASWTVGGTTPSFNFTVKTYTLKDTLADRVLEDDVSTTVAFPGYSAVDTLLAQLEVTAASGTAPTLDVVIQHSMDGGTNWYDLQAFTQATGRGNELKTITAKFGDQLRVRSTLGGTTPLFTYSVKVFAK